MLSNSLAFQLIADYFPMVEGGSFYGEILWFIDVMGVALGRNHYIPPYLLVAPFRYRYPLIPMNQLKSAAI